MSSSFALARTTLDLYSNGQSWRDANDSTQAALISLSSPDSWIGSLTLAVTDLLGLKAYEWPLADGDAGLGAKGAPATANVDAALPQIAAIASLSAFKLYPNPTNGALTLETAQGGEAVLYNLLGTVVWQQHFEKGTTTVQLPHSLSAGVYLVRFSGKDGSVRQTRLVYKP